MTYGDLQADCLYTGISSVPNARCQVWEASTFYLFILFLCQLMMADVVDGMVQYIRKNMPLISTELMSVSDVEVFIGRTDYSVVGDVSGFIYLNSVSSCCISFFQVTFLELFSLPVNPPVDSI